MRLGHLRDRPETRCKRGERIVGCHAMSIRARAHHHAEFLGRLHRWHALPGLRGPAYAQRFHAPQILRRRIVQMRDGPTQIPIGTS